MSEPRHRFFLRFLSAATLLFGLIACETSKIQLEPLRASLGRDGGDTEDGAEEVACVTILVGFGTQATLYDVLANGRPLPYRGSSGEMQIAVAGAGGFSGFCVAPGSYNLALSRQGEIVAQVGDLSLADGQQFMVIAYGAEQQANVKVSEVNLTPPGKGLRRMRITNIVPDQRPLQLIYYDGKDREIARSRIVAYGDTDVSTIRADVAFWRVEPDEARWPIGAGNGDSENRCAEPQATGVISLARDPAQTWTGFPHEIYLQPTRDCEPDPESESDGGAPREPTEPYVFPVEP